MAYSACANGKIKFQVKIGKVVDQPPQQKKPSKNSGDKAMPRNALRHLIQFELKNQAPVLFNKLLSDLFPNEEP